LLIYAQRFCEIPMQVLTSSPYSLSAGSLIEAKVQAFNANGWSSLSTDSTGAAIVQTVPITMTAPTRDSATTASTLVVDWASLSLANSGYSSITSYNL
jgi:hypothetical protein